MKKISIGLVALLCLCLAVVFWPAVKAATVHNITLNWNASTTPGVNYNLYRGTISGGPYTKLNTTPITGLTYSDTTGVGGTKYFHVETAICTAACPTGVSGESDFSNETSATFLGNPAAGAGLTAVAN